MPEGTFVVGLGLLVSGFAAYGFQIVSFRALGKGDYTALNGLWVIAFVLAPGFFLPLEQEVGRALAHRRSRGDGGGPVVRKAAVSGALLVGGLVVLTLAAEGISSVLGESLSEGFFHGRRILLVCLVVALATYAVQHLTRGTLSGNARFGPYGLVLAAEGVIRVVPAVVLYAAGVDELVWYGLCFAIPPVVASALALRGQRGLVTPGTEAPWSELWAHLSWLFAGSLLFQMLSYSPIVGILIVAEGAGQRALAADFIVGFFLARIPILLFQAVQAALLPKLAGLAGSGRHADFRSGIGKLLGVVVGVGCIGVLAGGTLGPTVGEILFGHKFTLDHEDLALLALGSGLFILALTLAQALIALMGHARAAWAWVVGNAWFWAITAVSSKDLFLRVELGFVGGSAVAVLVMLWLLRRQFHESIPPERLADFVKAVGHEPLEI